MATEQDLMLAILALDAYNEGDYSLGMDTGSEGIIGSAQLIADKSVPGLGFYAAAYSYGDEIIISYRGTTFSPDLNTVKDMYYGWTLSAGQVAVSQVQLALQFYTQVTGLQAPGGATPNNIILTGHSLGGGLAGFVADLTGASADIFNNIAFGSGVVGDPRGIAGAIEWLKAGPFNEMAVKLVVDGGAVGAPHVETLDRLIADAKKEGATS